MDVADNSFMVNDVHKHLFCTMIDMDIPPTIVKRVMSFWMFLESINYGFRSFCQSLLFADKSVIKRLCDQAEIALAFLESDDNNENNLVLQNPIPAAAAGAVHCYYYCYSQNTLMLVSRPFLFPINDVFGDKRRASDQIMAIRNNVCNVAFEDILEMKGLKSPSNNLRPAAEFKLNPAAEEWSPASVPQEQRSLFMTFSKGHPVSKPEIVTYFQGVYGECVEEVYIHKPRGGSRNPEFGKIVFKYALIAYLVLQNQEFIIYRIDDQKTIGLKRYRSAA